MRSLHVTRLVVASYAYVYVVVVVSTDAGFPDHLDSVSGVVDVDESALSCLLCGNVGWLSCRE